MADVYLASTTGPAGVKKLLVIKRLREGNEDEQHLVMMFLDEARIALRLGHPNVVQTYEVDVDEGLPFIAMEYLEGQPLHRVLRRFGEHGGMPREVYLWILCELLRGLHHAHELRDYDGRPLCIVHRDVNPQNVFVTYHGAIKLMDFGIAKAMDSVSQTEVGTFKGKLAYMAPEQARGGTALDRRVDLFSVGVMMWEALSGERMWRGRTDIEIATALTEGWIPPLPDHQELPDALRTICERAVALDPVERWPTAERMSDALQAWLDEHAELPGHPAFSRELSERFVLERERRAALIHRYSRAQGLEPPEEEEAEEEAEDIPFADEERTRRVTAPLSTMSASASGVLPVSEPTSTHHRTEEVRTTGAWARMLGAGLAGAGLAGVVFLAMSSSRDEAVERASPRQDDGAYISASAGDPFDSPRGSTPDADPELRPRCVPQGDPVELSGEIEKNATLRCDRIYLLRYATRVRAGVTLTIEPGTTILGDDVTRGTLVIEPGGRLHAEGRPDAPIVFTSAKPPGQRRPGDWGGVLVLGRAPINLRDHAGRSILGRVEGLAKGGRYGGDDPDDDSGVLRYLRIEYSGIELAPNNEVNGLTLAGVGRGTRLDHIQVRHAADDCFELFGGTVDGSHLLCDDPGDDGFDWDLGYQGTLRFLFVRSTEGRGQHGVEGDNDPSGSQVEPRSQPRLSNVTLCGAAGGERYGLLLRRGTDLKAERLLILGYPAAVDVRDPETSFEVIDSILGGPEAQVAVPERRGVLGGPEADDDGGRDEAAMLLQPGWRNVLSVPGVPSCRGDAWQALRPEAPLRTTGEPTGEPGADYVGAFRDLDDRWDEGWAVWSDSA